MSWAACSTARPVTNIGSVSRRRRLHDRTAMHGSHLRHAGQRRHSVAPSSGVRMRTGERANHNGHGGLIVDEGSQPKPACSLPQNLRTSFRVRT